MLALEMSSAVETFFGGSVTRAHKRSEKLPTPPVCWHELFSHTAFILSFSEHPLPFVLMRRVYWKGMGTDSAQEQFLSSMRPDNPWIPRPVAAGRGLNRTECSPLVWHFKQISIWYEIRCSWCCWWQQFSLKFEAYNLSHKAKGCDRLTSE